MHLDEIQILEEQKVPIFSPGGLVLLVLHVVPLVFASGMESDGIRRRQKKKLNVVTSRITKRTGSWLIQLLSTTSSFSAQQD